MTDKECSVCFDSTRAEQRVASCSHGADVCDGCHREFVRSSRVSTQMPPLVTIQHRVHDTRLPGWLRDRRALSLFPDRVARDALFERLAHACFRANEQCRLLHSSAVQPRCSLSRPPARRGLHVDRVPPLCQRHVLQRASATRTMASRAPTTRSRAPAGRARS
jgi:hypothetical protein